MAKATLRVIEWKIENFGCWCETLHGKCIQSPDIFNNPFGKVDLFPRGVRISIPEDYMTVVFRDVKRNLIGELTFMSSDGSSICSQQLEITQIVLVNLKFEEVAARIGKEKDEITLRFCIQSDEYYEQCMCTTIIVWKASFKIDPKSVESLKSDESKEISYLRYSSKEDKAIWLNLARQNKRVQLTMKPYCEKVEKFLCESSLSMLTRDNDLVRKEEAKHVFVKREAWTISESLTVKECKEKGISIFLRLKVVNGEIVEKYNYDNRDKNISIDRTGSTINVCEDKSSKGRDDSVRVLTNDLMCLYQDQDFSDLRLRCDDVTFPVHRALLSARSPVFKTMLSCDMQEAASGQVVVEDLAPSTLSLFLTYLYTGAVEALEYDRALKLYYAADKYQVPSLKRECSDFLCDKMSVETVCDVLTLAEHHKDDCLTAVSRDFVLNNYNDVLRSRNWESFMEKEPMLALKTVTYFAKKNYVGKIPVP